MAAELLECTMLWSPCLLAVYLWFPSAFTFSVYLVCLPGVFTWRVYLVFIPCFFLCFSHFVRFPP